MTRMDSSAAPVFRELTQVIRTVRRWRGLKAEPKLAFLYLLEVAGGVGLSCVANPASLGLEMGTSDRAGRRYLETLALAGLISIPDRQRTSGDVIIYLHDPRVVARARLIPGGQSGQGELPFQPDAEQDADTELETRDASAAADVTPCVTPRVTPQPPAEGQPSAVAADMVSHPPGGATPELPTTERGSADAVSHPPGQLPYGSREALSLSFNSSLEELVRARSLSLKSLSLPADVTPQPPPPIPTQKNTPQTPGPRIHRAEGEIPLLGDGFGQIIKRLPTDQEREKNAREWAHRLRLRVADPLLQEGPCLRVGWALVSGELEPNDVEEVMRRLDCLRNGKKLHVAAWSYFVGAMRRKFNDKGVPWATVKKPP